MPSPKISLLESLIVAATIGFSSPAGAQSIADPCPLKIVGGMGIKDTLYCTDPSGTIYHRDGKPLGQDSLDIILEIRKSSVYAQAVEAARARSQSSSSPSTPASLPSSQQQKKVGLPGAYYIDPQQTQPQTPGERPPYLQPAAPTPSPSALSQSDTSTSPISSRKKDSDYYWGIADLLVGGMLMVLGAQPITVCENNNCQQDIPAFGYLMIGGGALIALDGLYLLVR